MAKLDLASAYRSVKIHSLDHEVTGLAWTFKGDAAATYMFDTRLMFGACLAPSIFNDLSQTVVVMMRNKGLKNVYTYCDDFLIIEHDKARCLSALNTLWRLCRKLGFAINHEKVIGPSTAVVFLGTNIDTESMTLALPQEKLEETLLLLKESVTAKNITKRNL